MDYRNILVYLVNNNSKVMPSNINKGIKENHLNAAVWFEKTYNPPAHGNSQISRLYDDGSYYLLSDSGTWTYISQLTSAGLNEMKEVLEECCLLKSSSKENGNQPGMVIWELLCSNEYHQITIAGIPTKEFHAFKKVEKILNTQMQTIPSDHS